MILPVVAYGHPVLKKIAQNMDKDYPNFDEFLTNMWETMYHTDGVGLAAPQVNKSVRLFVIDASDYQDEITDVENLKQVFINAMITKRTGENVLMSEGCLSLPGIREDVERPTEITIEYYDENWNFHEKTYTGMFARIIQHEYDHLEGTVFTDRLSPIRKAMLRNKLSNISKGKVQVDYKMIFPFVNKRRR